ncbi:MAG: hypothetical protein LBP92_05970 [Deltaproteobacteria bacterium]|jgi:MraZ protein|nr:hypothetical protein [Deltaproteobacteria bacterium]
MADSPIIFSGRYGHAVDDKGRLMLPSALRDELRKSDVPDRLYLGFCPGTRFLSVYSYERWKELVGSWRDERRFPGSSVMQDGQRLFFANLEPVNVDRSGRILISAYYRERAGLGAEVAVLGVADKIEIWDPAELAAQEERAREAWELALAAEAGRAPGGGGDEPRLPRF